MIDSATVLVDFVQLPLAQVVVGGHLEHPVQDGRVQRLVQERVHSVGRQFFGSTGTPQLPNE